MTSIDVSTLDGGIMLVTINGPLDMEGTAAVENQFTFNTDTQKQAVLVDMSGVDYMSSIGIRLLMTNAKALHAGGGAMALLAPQVLVRDILENTGTHLVIPMYEDRTAAITALSDILNNSG